MWETEKPTNLEAMEWALAWYKVERQETRKSKPERVVYLTPKSSTTKTKSIGARDMFEETWSGGFVETKSGEKRDEAKVGEFSRLLEAVHRSLFYAKDNLGLAGGVGFKEWKEIEAGENGGGELMGEEFDVLGRVEVGAKVEVGEIDGAEERVVGDDRVEEDVDGR